MQIKSFRFLLPLLLLTLAACEPPTTAPVPRYGVTYLGNGADSGQAPVDAALYAAGETVAARGNTGGLAKTGHSLLAWNTSPAGTGVQRNLGSTFTMGNQNLVLHAQWEAESYLVTFDPNGGEGTMAAQTVVYGMPEALNANTLTNSSLVFVGWAATAGGAVEWQDEALYTSPAESRTLYARWSTGITFSWGPYSSLVFTPAAATVDSGESVTLEPALTGGSGWQWYVDNVLADETSSSFAFTSTAVGHHVVSVVVTVDGAGYSGSCVVIVNQ